MNYVAEGRGWLAAADVPKPGQTMVDWARMWGGFPSPKPVEPEKPADPRSEALGRAIDADKPLDGYGRRP